MLASRSKDKILVKSGAKITFYGKKKRYPIPYFSLKKIFVF